MQEKNLKIDLELCLSSERIAQIVYDVLRVDAEPKRSGVVKVLTVENNVLKGTFTANQARQLRVAINNFFEKADLVLETVQVMGPPVSEKYDYYYE
ncbi:uncharacterized protein LOC126735165 isoform X2 [Anthonomus grandis grandis]|uniref:uncharacterized protein LOC126735165 isoform X2 n=1 Tax=Anthonomus grandis grandis TaxID=2921223 RepID=UPI00216523BF|nr:uncharacterized protein LOC126735165 isoform X2 [Anthonomus grandis grandis]